MEELINYTAERIIDAVYAYYGGAYPNRDDIVISKVLYMLLPKNEYHSFWEKVATLVDNSDNDLLFKERARRVYVDPKLKLTR